MKSKLDKTWFGLLFGMALPLLFAILFLDSTYTGEGSIPDILSAMSTNSMIIKLLCVAIFPDMCGVFLLNTLEMWRACRGMFAALGFYMMICCLFLILNTF